MGPDTVMGSDQISPQEAFDELVQAVRDAKIADDQSMSEEELRKMWPFDIE